MLRRDPERILIVLHGSIGDVTRALPLANRLRRGYPRARLSWAIEPASLPIVESHPAVDEPIVFERHRGWAAVLPFVRRIRRARFDLVLDLQRHLKSGIVSFLSGAPVRIGFHRSDAKEFNWLFNNHFIERLGDTVPKLEHYLRFGDYLGLAAGPIEWGLRLNEGEREQVERYLRPVTGGFAALFAGTRWESKGWFADQIADCAAVLRERFRLESVLLGGGADRAIGEEAGRRANGRILNLVGRTSLREAIGIIGRARIAIGPDTGLMHLAAAVGTPVVSLWGATSAFRAGPHGFEHLAIHGRASCAPCYRRRCPIGRICMRSIDVGEIADKARDALADRERRELTGGIRA